MSAGLPGKRVVVVLFTAAACALLAAGTLTAVAVSNDAKAGERAATPVGRPSPTLRPSSTRPAGPPLCLVGSWRSVEEVSVIKFYTDQPPMLFSASGRHFEFRPDGTGVERQDNVVYTSSFQGNELRIVGNGTVDFTWKADGGSIAYQERTRGTLAWSYYDQRGLLSTQPVQLGRVDEVDDYTCDGTRATEGNASGYRASWIRTTAFGVYGA